MILMFMAYSETKNKIVDVSDEYNLEEIFSCPDVNCPAKLKIKSPFGKTAKHFAQLKSKPHSPECIYASGNNRYLATKPQVRLDIEDIYAGSSIHNAVVHNQSIGEQRSSVPHTRTKQIRTPRDLYEFCVINRLSAEYQNGKTVADIVLDSRNLSKRICFVGVEGLRLVIGETVKYDGNDMIIKVQGRDKSDSPIWLTAHLKMYSSLMQEMRRYLFDTYGNIKGHKIAVFEKWKTDSSYHISCTVNNRQHLIYKIMA